MHGQKYGTRSTCLRRPRSATNLDHVPTAYANSTAIPRNQSRENAGESWLAGPPSQRHTPTNPLIVILLNSTPGRVRLSILQTCGAHVHNELWRNGMSWATLHAHGTGPRICNAIAHRTPTLLFAFMRWLRQASSLSPAKCRRRRVTSTTGECPDECHTCLQPPNDANPTEDADRPLVYAAGVSADAARRRHWRLAGATLPTKYNSVPPRDTFPRTPGGRHMSMCVCS